MADGQLGSANNYNRTGHSTEKYSGSRIVLTGQKPHRSKENDLLLLRSGGTGKRKEESCSHSTHYKLGPYHPEDTYGHRTLTAVLPREGTLTTVLDNHTTYLRVTTQSKKWWTTEDTTKDKEYSRIRWLHKQRRINILSLRAEPKTYYYIVWPTKLKCWVMFLHSMDEIMRGKKCYWTAL